MRERESAARPPRQPVAAARPLRSNARMRSWMLIAILLGGPADLEVRRTVQELRPTYYAVFPLDPSELRDAVAGALAHYNGRNRPAT